MKTDVEPHAEIIQTGRWWHLVCIIDGPMQYGPSGDGWYRFGRRMAIRTARVQLARYLQREQRRANPTIVRKGKDL